MQNYIAQSQIPLGGTRFQGLGQLGDTTLLSSPFATLNDILSIMVGIITLIAGIFFIFLIITGGLMYMSAGGDKGKVQEAQKKITSGLIGLVIVFAGVLIAGFISYVLGVNILNPGLLLFRLGGR